MPVFVDTNVLVYSRDSSEGEKQRRAQIWLQELWERRTGRVSTQVLSEYYVTVTRKLSPGLAPREARSDVRDLMSWRPLPVDGSLVEAAWTEQDSHGLSYWDSLIVACARRAGCEVLLTEDLQDGQDLGGTVVVNPFLHGPDQMVS